MMKVESIKDITREVFPEMSEEELDRRANEVFRHGNVIEGIQKALDEENVSYIRLWTVVYYGMFCIRFSNLTSIKKWNAVNAVTDKFEDSLKMVSETKTTVTFQLV